MNNRHYGSAVSFAAAAAAAAALAMAGAVHAQNAPAAAPGGGEAPQLNEIIVTAQRVAQRLLDVPISISVLSQQQLSNRNIVTAADLATYVPSLSVGNQFGSDYTTFSIRGFSQALQTAPTVAVYFDDAVVPHGGDTGTPAGNGAGPGSFFDLQNVQVLAGPQGTLFGVNTTGGAVLLVPNRPTSEFGGYAEATYGNYDLVREQGVVNLPVNDRFRVRLGVDRETRNGYLQNVSGIGPSTFDNIDYTAARLSAVLDVTPNIENYVVGSYSLSNDNGTLPQVFACNPKASLGSFACAQLTRQQTYGPYAVQNDEPSASSYVRQYQIVDTTTWQAPDAMTVKNIFNYGQIRGTEDMQVFGTDFSIPKAVPRLGGTLFSLTDQQPAPGAPETDQYTFSDELRLQGSSFANRLNWQGGGYIERSAPTGVTGQLSENAIDCANPDAMQCFDVLGTLDKVPGRVGTLSAGTTKYEYNDLAGYGQATYSLTSRLKLTGGLRYTTDWTDAAIQRLKYSFPTTNTPRLACNSPASLASDCWQSFQQKSSAPTWVVDLDYHPRENTLVYGKYARGYREGGVDNAGANGNQTFAPEHLDDFEVGEKSSFDGLVPGSFDANVFYNRFTNQQILVGFVGPPGVSPTSDIINVGKSRIYGADVDTLLKPFRGFELGASYAYLRTEVLAYAPVTPTAPYTTVSFPTTVGGPLPLAPTSKLSANADYLLPLPQSVGAVKIGAVYTYTSSQFVGSAAETPYGTLAGYGLVDLNLDWESIANSPVDVELFVTNLANKLYYDNVSQIYYTEGFEARWIGAPRMYGLRVRVRFGQ